MLTPSDSPPVCARIFKLTERNPHRAVSLARQALMQAGDHRQDAAWVLFALGWSLLRAERFDEAQRRLAEAQAHFEQLDLGVGALHCRRSVLIAAVLRGAGSATQLAWSELATAYERRGLAVEAARTRVQQAAHLVALGRPRDALALTHSITERIEVDGTPDDRARLLRVTAIAQANLGALDHAEARLGEAMRLFAALGYRAEVAKCVFERAHFNHRRERFGAALADLAEALAVFERLDLPLQIAFCLKSIGLARARFGRYGEAIADTVRARAGFQALERFDHAAECDLNLGTVAYYSGLYDLALAAYRRAEAAFLELDQPQPALWSRRNQAHALRAMGTPQAALDLLAALKEPALSLGDAVEMAEITQLEARALHDLGDYDAALRGVRDAHAQFLALSNIAGAAQCLLDEGWLQLDRHDAHAARACLNTARPVLADRPAHLWRLEYGLARCAELADDPSTALAHYAAASQIIATLRRTLASEHASSGIFAQTQALFVDAVRLAADLGAGQEVLSLAEEQRAVALHRQLAGLGLQAPSLQAASNTLRQALRDLIARNAAAADMEATLSSYTEVVLQARHSQPPLHELTDATLDLPRLQVRLDRAFPHGWIVLTYVECRDELLIVTLTNEGTALSRTPLDVGLRHSIEHATAPAYRRWTYLDLARQRQPERPQWQTLAELGRRLLPAALDSRLDGKARLLLAPSAALVALPWSALRIGDKWLCERTVIQVLPSLSHWSTLDERTVPGRAALLLGCSSFGPRAPALPNVPAELDLVAERWSGPLQRMEDAALTRAALLDLALRGDLRIYSLIHVATHAQLLSAHGLLAHLKLWDDDLLLDEALRLNLAGASVVLASCEGAAGEMLPGDELLSLARAFFAAGARDVVASAWPIYDRAVEHLFTRFYDALAQGLDAPSALASAQRASLRADGPAALPLIWASFSAFGAGTLPAATAGGTTPAVAARPFDAP
jgi:CHAT domain-containing protein